MPRAVADDGFIRSLDPDDLVVLPGCVVRSRPCLYCKRTFYWAGPAQDDDWPRYHSRTCKTKARRERQAARAEITERRPTQCPRPDKALYLAPGEAKRAALKASHDFGQPLTAYPCACSGWHIGNHLF